MRRPVHATDAQSRRRHCVAGQVDAATLETRARRRRDCQVDVQSAPDSVQAGHCARRRHCVRAAPIDVERGGVPQGLDEPKQKKKTSFVAASLLLRTLLQLLMKKVLCDVPLLFCFALVCYLRMYLCRFPWVTSGSKGTINATRTTRGTTVQCRVHSCKDEW